MSYKSKNNIRIVTAASLFDGHDASINIIRRLLQDGGAEVIHLGHNRSVREIVEAALSEGAQGICISSYQGGHMEFFKYMYDMLKEANASYIKIFGGGGGVIIHEEKAELEAYGIKKIFHPDDGRRLGLQGMIDLILQECDFNILDFATGNSNVRLRDLGLMVTALEQGKGGQYTPRDFSSKGKNPVVLGVTGTGGAGKSSLVDELLQRFLNAWPTIQIGVFCVDPSKRKTGGGLLGDRIRMNSLLRSGVFMRSMASRGSGNELSGALPIVLAEVKKLAFDLIIVETSGIGQSSAAVTSVSDLSLYVMTSEFGAPSQLEKIDMIDYADLIAINKADHRGAQDALRDVRKQYGRSRKMFDHGAQEKFPVYLTQASQFNDRGINNLFFKLCDLLAAKDKTFSLPEDFKDKTRHVDQKPIILPERQNYLSEIVSTIRGYKKSIRERSEAASQLGALEKAQNLVPKGEAIQIAKQKIESALPPEDTADLKSWDNLKTKYQQEQLEFQVRDRKISQALTRTTLSGKKVHRVSFPSINDWGDRLRFLRLENVPGSFPYTAGVFPLKRPEEDPKRMFAGEGTPERTNKRFHFLSQSEPAKRLSTAFDSVTLYGQDPDLRPDIYGKVGESGVSICTLEDMEKLYSGFDLCAPNTSVSMTINGPAPIILAFFMNTAINQQVRRKEAELGRALDENERREIEARTLSTVRGTVQADILKEDQGQNTCIFSINFALKMMGDIQEFFNQNNVRNFYSVSISGYHIAEAGANPISQLAFTLSNGLTLVEYYLSRGLKVDDFAPNLSFFFSNGMDAEYTVLGRVARRIWSIAMKERYDGNERSQKLKYHIQTSGRSLHAQEIAFNDIRTTLQALIAIFDNCNSLHTNAYDEAITTPTEESVRRAMAIQMIINKEFGWAFNENTLQGSYFIEELTDLVEEAVLEEFLRISERGGVLGAMETQYQRSKIQEESLYYETLKHSGELPIVGVNTYIDPKTLDENYLPPKIPMARASKEEKETQLKNLKTFHQQNEDSAAKEIENLKAVALAGGNIFAALMSASRHCSLYQMTQALYEIGGQYRRNI